MRTVLDKTEPNERNDITPQIILYPSKQPRSLLGFFMYTVVVIHRTISYYFNHQCSTYMINDSITSFAVNPGFR